jgi:diacylglycerol kinase family enzyme
MSTPHALEPTPASQGAAAPFFIVMNDASGSGDADECRRSLTGVFDEAGRRHEFLLAQRPTELSRLAKRAVDAAQKEHGAVIAVGGDGTINTVLQEVLPTGLPFGLVPQGTFNYSGRTHGIPLEAADAAKVLLSARLTPVQVGVVNKRAFLVNASIGLYPQVLQDREHFKRQYGRNRTNAMFSALLTLARGYRRMTLSLDLDGEKETLRALTLFVGNNELQLERIGLPEAEDVQKRRLVGVLVHPVGVPALFGLAVRGALGRLGDADHVRDFAFRKLSVTPLHRDGPKGIRIAIDGEILWMQPPLEFSVAPTFLQLMTPA